MGQTSCFHPLEKRTNRDQPPACLPFPSDFAICRLFSRNLDASKE